jgi:hypothetical protein
VKRGWPEVSRRALLGAVCASPLVRHSGLGPESTSSSPAPEGRRWIPDQVRDDENAESCAVTIWDRALARLHQAQATLDAASHEADQDSYDTRLDAHTEALSALLALPAPDLPALAAKLDHILAHLAWELTGSEGCLEILRHDAHRLGASTAG